jgi:hypothetical protein
VAEAEGQIPEKNNEIVHPISLDFKESYDSVRREVHTLYNIPIELGIPMKPRVVIFIKMCLNEVYCKVDEEIL